MPFKPSFGNDILGEKGFIHDGYRDPDETLSGAVMTYWAPFSAWKRTLKITK